MSIFEHRRFADALHAGRAEDRKLVLGDVSVLALGGIADVILHDFDCIRAGIFDNLWGLWWLWRGNLALWDALLNLLTPCLL